MLDDSEVLKFLELEAFPGSIGINGLNQGQRQWEAPLSVLAPHRLATRVIQSGDAEFALWMRQLRAAGAGNRQVVSLVELTKLQQAMELSRSIPSYWEPSVRTVLLKEAFDFHAVPDTSGTFDDLFRELSVGERLSRALELVRKESREKPFRSKESVRRSEAMRNAATARTVLAKLLRRTRRCQVLRLNIQYLRPVGDPQLDLSQISIDFARLRNCWRKYGFHDELKGYLWRVQFGWDAGYYYHLVCVLRAKVPLHKLLTDVQEAWHGASRGKGVIQDCSTAFPIYSNGSGVWDREERTELRSSLLDSVEYLLRRDEYLKPAIGKRRKVWDHTELGLSLKPRPVEKRSLENLRIRQPSKPW